jgi:hypothetical protein
MTRTTLLGVTLVGGASALAAGDVAEMNTAELMRVRPASQAVDAAGRFYNVEAVIPPQCYTKIEGRFNPCYVCHQSYDDRDRPNYMRDGSLQEAYNFSDAALTNHWANLFVDRSAEVAAISDAEILAWIGTDNYTALPAWLEEQGWNGWTPDLADYHLGAAAFDERGFARDGSGWVAFNYKPQPSTFWPTNGSTDDVAIRLAEPFRTDADGEPSRDVYLANLALLEMAFQDLDETTVPPIDETAVSVDLDGDGAIGAASRVLRRDSYLGGAASQPLRRMLYPEGTEFVHSVRYVGVENDEIVTPPRMKELRYMRKTAALTPAELRTRYGNEHQEKEDGNLPRYVDVGDLGMDNGFGWVLSGFIEDADGALRPQTDEEQFFCKGCHTTVGANLDQTWAFPRKVTGAEGWGYIDYRGMPDRPNFGQEKAEIELYFERIGGGDEFRSNEEMQARWFRSDGSVDREAVRAADVYDLITPSPERALELDKAYRVLVDKQSFLFGRDATVTPPDGVHRKIDAKTAPTLPPEKRYDHDIRLDW